MKPEVHKMVICYFMKVPEVERQVRDKYTKFTKDHVFHELPFAGVTCAFSPFSIKQILYKTYLYICSELTQILHTEYSFHFPEVSYSSSQGVL